MIFQPKSLIFRYSCPRRRKRVDLRGRVVERDSMMGLNQIWRWLHDNGVTPVGTEACKVSLFKDENGDRGVMSLTEIQPNESFLRIPMKIVIADHADDETSNQLLYKSAPYSVRLACKLLRERSLKESSNWFPYIQSLPLHIPCPLLDFTKQDLQSLDYPEIIDQFDSYKTMVAESWKKLKPEAYGDVDWDGYLWAISIVHSRSFGTDGKQGPLGIHMFVPLVDMFNHGGDFCQGLYTAPKLKLDSAEWTLIKPESSMTGQWEMDVKSSSKIEPNSQILMSYGERSNDDFFLYYGFIPPMNPNDDYVLFPSLDSALDWYIEQFLSSEVSNKIMKLKEKAKQRGESRELSEILQSSPSAEKEQLKLRIMSGGFVDGRLLAAFDQLGEVTKITRQQAIKKRCWELITSHTCLIHDLGILADALPDSEHNFPFLLKFYSNALEKFQQAGGELPPTKKAHEEETGNLSFSQKLIKTYLCYKRIILCDVLLNLNRTFV